MEKLNKILILGLLSAISAYSATQPIPVRSDTNGNLLAPTNFMTANIVAGDALAIERTNDTKILITFVGGITNLSDVTNSMSGILDGDVLTWNATTGKWNAEPAPGAGSGEANTSTNVGSGVGIANDKVTFALPFKSFVTDVSGLITWNTNETNIQSTFDWATATGGLATIAYVDASGAGEVNYNGLADPATNTTTIFGLVYGKDGDTNLLINLVEGDGYIDLSLLNSSNLQFSLSGDVALDTEVADATNDLSGVLTTDLNGASNVLRTLIIDATNNNHIDLTADINGASNVLQTAIDAKLSSIPVSSNGVAVGNMTSLGVFSGTNTLITLTNNAGEITLAVHSAGGGGGEENTMSSDSGVSIVNPKAGVDLPVKGFNVGQFLTNATTISIVDGASVTNINHYGVLSVEAGSSSAPSIEGMGASVGINFDASSIGYFVQGNEIRAYWNGTSFVVTNSDLAIGQSLTMSMQTANRALYINSFNQILSSVVTRGELERLSGVTGGIQTNIDARLASIPVTSNGVVVGSVTAMDFAATGTNTLFTLTNDSGTLKLAVHASSGGGGEANTMSSGTGVSIVNPKSGIDLPVKGFNPGQFLTNATTISIASGASVTNLDHYSQLQVQAGSAGTPSIAPIGISNAGINLDPNSGGSGYLIANGTIRAYWISSGFAVTNAELIATKSVILPYATADRVLILNSLKQVTNSANIDSTELSFIDNLAENAQVAFDNLQAGLYVDNYLSAVDAATNYVADFNLREATINGTNHIHIAHDTNGPTSGNKSEWICTITNLSGSGRTLSFPASWVWLGTTNNPPTDIPSGYGAVLWLKADATRVFAGYSPGAIP